MRARASVCVDNEISVVDDEFKLIKSTTGMDSRENIWDGIIDLAGGGGVNSGEEEMDTRRLGES